MADDLSREGLIDIDVGVAAFRHTNQPAAPAHRYGMRITEEGKTALAKVESAG